MSTIVRFYKDGKKVKEIISIGYLPVDESPVEGSRHLVTSGAVAEAVCGITGLVSETKSIPKSSYAGECTFDTRIENFTGYISLTAYFQAEGTVHIYVYENETFNGLASDIKHNSDMCNFVLPLSVKEAATIRVNVTSGALMDNTNVTFRLRGLGKAL